MWQYVAYGCDLRFVPTASLIRHREQSPRSLIAGDPVWGARPARSPRRINRPLTGRKRWKIFGEILWSGREGRIADRRRASNGEFPIRRPRRNVTVTAALSNANAEIPNKAGGLIAGP
jgi:hypothetical protein